jgi:hypothetical protein
MVGQYIWWVNAFTQEQFARGLHGYRAPVVFQSCTFTGKYGMLIRNALGRQTICFSRSIQIHDIVIGLFVNRMSSG